MANSSAERRLTGMRGEGRGVGDLGKGDVVGFGENDCGGAGEG